MVSLSLLLFFIVIGGSIAILVFRKKKPTSADSILDAGDFIATNPGSTRDFSHFDGLTISERLDKAKEYYPFEKWSYNFKEYDMQQYTPENVAAAKKVFDDLTHNLNQVYETADKQAKVALFKEAVQKLNSMNKKVEGLIETGEREDLCELIDQIGMAVDLHPTHYADREGLADLWRNW